MHPPSFTRRVFLKGVGLCACSALLPSQLALAAAETEKRLLLVILRGGMDGLAAVVPYGDDAYADVRGPIAMPQNTDTLINLDGFFALPKALAPLADLYQQKELLILHAAATPYRDHSHFDAQNILENGALAAYALPTGWLSRAVDTMPGASAVALAPNIPLVLQGATQASSWAPSSLQEVDDDFLSRVAHMYQSDPLLAASVADMALADDNSRQGRMRTKRDFVSMMDKAASFLSAPRGARIGVINLSGWDTHSMQGTTAGKLAASMETLTNGLLSFRQGMGSAWNDTAVLVVTEFGRTVRGNGSGGTDHGTATAAFLLGGRVNGGRVIGDWPGLGALYKDRDLIPANDLRSLLKGTLNQHLGIQEAQLTDTIFPDSRDVPSFPLLFS